jgi:nucleoid DNA-binding protein
MAITKEGGKGYSFPRDAHAPTKTAVLNAVSSATGLPRQHVGKVMNALAALAAAEIARRGTFTLPGMAKLKVVKKGATRARQGINPFAKEAVVLKAKPRTLSKEKGAEVQALRAEAEGILEGTRHEPLRSAFATRALRGIRRLAEDGALEAIAEAVAAPTDTEAVVKALEQPDSLRALAEADPLLPARVRGLRERERLLSLEGGTWDAQTAARHLHLTRQGINRRRRLGTLLGIGVGRRGYLYPAWQFARVGTLTGIEQVFAALAEHDPWMRAVFMLSASDRLDARPLDALRAGRLDEVVAAAGAFGQHGAG